jgi:hypothetical protein
MERSEDTERDRRSRGYRGKPTGAEDTERDRGCRRFMAEQKSRGYSCRTKRNWGADKNIKRIPRGTEDAEDPESDTECEQRKGTQSRKNQVEQSTSIVLCTEIHYLRIKG